MGVENTDDVINNDVSVSRGWPGQLATRFAGLLGIGEGGLVTAQYPGIADNRVDGIGATNLNRSGPMNSGVSVTNVSNGGAPGTVTFTLPVSTQIDILVYQSTNGAPTTRAFKYSVDDGADVAVANTDQKYRGIAITGLAASTHTVKLKGDSTAASYFFGVRHSMGKGVVVGRFARPGWTMLDAFGLGSNANMFGNAGALARIADAWGAWSSHLTIITFNHNDCGYQANANPSGLYSTTTTYRNICRPPSTALPQRADAPCSMRPSCRPSSRPRRMVRLSWPIIWS